MKKILITITMIAIITCFACKKNTPTVTDVEITNTYRQELPATRFIGKAYTEENKVNGSFSACWEEWFANDWFTPLQSLVTTEFLAKYPDAKAPVGLEKTAIDTHEFTYLIGMFLPENTKVPDGYIYYDFPLTMLGVCWIKGGETDIFFKEELAFYRLMEDGFTPMLNLDGTQWIFERYAPDRYKLDDNQKYTLDICFLVE